MVHFNDFKKAYRNTGQTLSGVVSRVLRSGHYILGPETESFEKKFAAYVGARYCVGVASGLDALTIALRALKIGMGDEVITVSNSAVATVLSIVHAGSKPVFADIDEYFHIDAHDAERKITSKTRAIIPVHLFGQMADMGRIMKLAKKHNISVIEDACQAHGSELYSKKAGVFGALGCYSFYPTKNLGAFGDGGAIVTNSRALLEKCRLLRNYGQKNRYIHINTGYNSRLDEIQAALLNVQLKHLDARNFKRIRLAEKYMEFLASIKQIKLPRIREGGKHVFHLFVIQAEKRELLREYLIKSGIETLVHYPIPIHKQRAFQEYKNVKLYMTEENSKSILSLPCHPDMSVADVKKICVSVKRFYGYG